MFGATTVRLDGSRPDGILYRRAPSAFLNYGASWATGGGQALNLESGLSVRGSLLTSSFFLSSSGQASRGLTAAIIDDTRRLTRYQVGDEPAGQPAVRVRSPDQRVEVVRGLAHFKKKARRSGP